MAETPGRPLGTQHADDTTSPTDDIMAAIRDTRLRLGERLTRTADHVGLLFTAPASADAEAGEGGVLGGAVETIAVVGRIKRPWDDAKRTGLLRRAAIGAAAIAIAAALVVKRRSR